jgi:serpin B
MTRQSACPRKSIALVGLLFLGCGSESSPGKTDTAMPDASSKQDTVSSPADAVEVAPAAAEVADAAPAKLDARPQGDEVADTTSLADQAPAPLDAGPGPVDTAMAMDTTPSMLDTSPSTDGGGAQAGIDGARSQVQRILDPQVSSDDASTLAADNAAFAFAAYRKLTGSFANLVFSPASISIALAMTYGGAAGTTAADMAQALHFSLPPARLHPAFNALDQALASRGEGQLGADGGPMRVRIVNALWAEQTHAFLASYLDLMAANYGAGVNLLDFINAPEPSRLAINAWVAEATEDKIPELLPADTIQPSTRLVLTNAVYLNAQWRTVFAAARDGTFYRSDNTTVTVKLMSADVINLPAYQGTGYTAVSIPYADPQLSLVLVVPDTGQFAQVEAGLDASALANVVAAMTTKRVGLTLPRFRIETGAKLKELLSALGMGSVFAAGADFSGMDGGRDLLIDEVVHKAFINVAEKGTEAAAATGVVMKDASIPMVDLTLTANRPFLYFLRDAPTGAILFMGRVMDPSGS